MKWYLAVMVLIATAAMGEDEGNYTFGVTDDGLLPPARRNAYGPGIDSDAAGRPFSWAPKDQPHEGSQNVPNPALDIVPDGYGLGVGRDQYGRPMERRPWPPK
ncbi:MAG: hypothetical protein NTZ78_01215 [Candidatus Aureabacteria bacterium]|nr:hypothetical protein [Candidatus Auribacterota bacterium]